MMKHLATMAEQTQIRRDDVKAVLKTVGLIALLVGVAAGVAWVVHEWPGSAKQAGTPIGGTPPSNGSAHSPSSPAPNGADGLTAGGSSG